MSAPSKPLAGLKVIELGSLIAGPFAARICAEFGAEVIKVESPDGGDPLRKWRKLYEGTSLWWFVQARNKKSLTLNLKHPEGLAILKKLLSEADILIENFRPGTLERWGMAPDALHPINPKLIIVRVSGYGQTGPYADRAGFGLVGEAIDGCERQPAVNETVAWLPGRKAPESARRRNRWRDIRHRRVPGRLLSSNSSTASRPEKANSTATARPIDARRYACSWRNCWRRWRWSEGRPSPLQPITLIS